MDYNVIPVTINTTFESITVYHKIVYNDGLEYEIN